MSGSEKDLRYRDKEWLKEQIEVLGKSYAQIGRECGVCYTTISYWYDDSQKQYRQNNKEHFNNYFKIYRKNNKERLKGHARKYARNNSEAISKRRREYTQNIKKAAFEVLGGCKCQLCDITDTDLLTIDHIDSAGYLDEKSGFGGRKLYISVARGTYPKEKLSNLRVLCWNHNDGRQKEYLDIPPELQTTIQKYYTRLWNQAFSLFGGCPCEITELKFLQVSHKNDDGNKKRKKGEHTGVRLLMDFNKIGWPKSLKEDYCLECANCNCGRRIKKERSKQTGVL